MAKKVAVALAIASLLGCDSSTNAANPTLELEACHLAPLSRPTECGTLRVWEDREAKSGRSIDLNIAVVRAWGARVEADPLFVLAGGPGQAATQLAVVAAAFRRVNEHRDIVLVDQRGTGKSNALTCERLPDTLAELLREADVEDVRRCLAQLTGEPRFYTTDIAMDDLDDVRAALGYERINLFGASYGTRAALIYMRRHPERTRRVILDGAAPTDVRLVAHVGRDAQRALDMQFARCAADAKCADAFGDVGQRFATLLADLEAEPASVRLSHPRTNVAEDVVITRDAVATMVRTALYMPQTAAMVPLIVDRAARGDFAPLLGTFAAFSGEETSLAAGMYMSVVCAEDEPRITPEQRAGLVDNFVGATPLRVQRESCAIWPAAKMPEAYFEPVSSDAPTLILSGELDPVLPPSWGDLTAQTLSAVQHVVVAGAGHGIAMQPCMARAIDDFLDSAEPLAVEHTCDDLAEPFALGARGER